jgi:isoleucyl-tRNA synthetase
VQAALEEKRRDKVIGSSLEAHVVIKADHDQYELLAQYASDLPSVFIVSAVDVNRSPGSPDGPGMRITVHKAAGLKCERCWNYRPSVGQDRIHPTLCDRCLEAIR